MILSKSLQHNIPFYFECQNSKSWVDIVSFVNIYNLLFNLTFQVLHDGSKELAQNDKEFSKYVLSSENKVSVLCLTRACMTRAFVSYRFIIIANGCKEFVHLVFWFMIQNRNGGRFIC